MFYYLPLFFHSHIWFSTSTFMPGSLACSEQKCLVTYFMRVLNHMRGKCLFYKCGIVPQGCFASQMSLMNIRGAVFFRKVIGFFLPSFFNYSPQPEGLARNSKQRRLQETCFFYHEPVCYPVLTVSPGTLCASTHLAAALSSSLPGTCADSWVSADIPSVNPKWCLWEWHGASLGRVRLGVRKRFFSPTSHPNITWLTRLP